MARTSLATAVLLALVAVPSASFGQTTAGSIPNLVKSGQRLSIVDDGGRQVEGRVGRITNDTITLSFRGATMDMPLERIVRIDRTDSLRNGALIGLALGVTAGIIGGASDHQGRGRRASFIPISAVGNGVIWMALGTGIDVLADNRRTIYQRGEGTTARLMPLVGRGAGGAAVSLTW